jgi:hypothetical protein
LISSFVFPLLLVLRAKGTVETESTGAGTRRLTSRPLAPSRHAANPETFVMNKQFGREVWKLAQGELSLSLFRVPTPALCPAEYLAM